MAIVLSHKLPRKQHQDTTVHGIISLHFTEQVTFELAFLWHVNTADNDRPCCALYTTKKKRPSGWQAGHQGCCSWRENLFDIKSDASRAIIKCLTSPRALHTSLMALRKSSLSQTIEPLHSFGSSSAQTHLQRGPRLLSKWETIFITA